MFSMKVILWLHSKGECFEKTGKAESHVSCLLPPQSQDQGADTWNQGGASQNSRRLAMTAWFRTWKPTLPPSASSQVSFDRKPSQCF